MNGVRGVRMSKFIPRAPRRVSDRLLMEGTFATLGGLFLLPSIMCGGSRYDAVLYVGAQPAIAWLGRVVAQICGAPFIVKVTDLAAQAALDVGIVRSRFLTGLFEQLEFSAYGAAQSAIVLCDAFRESFVRHGVSREAIHTIPDPVDLETICPGGSGCAFRERFGIAKGEFVILYSGSLGLKQNLFDVVEAAKLVSRDYSDVKWVLVGEGETRLALAQQIETAQMAKRVLLLPLQPAAEMNEMFAAADVLLLSQLRAVKETVIPSKLLTYMSAGRPILAAVNAGSQAANVVRDAGCGLLIEPECPNAFAEAIR